MAEKLRNCLSPVASLNLRFKMKKGNMNIKIQWLVALYIYKYDNVKIKYLRKN